MSELNQEEIIAMDFETAFRSLQENVAQLENEELSLEKALEVYERGQFLARHCADLLETAELKVRQLSEDAKLNSEPEG